MATPPNPFDADAVAAYLAEREAKKNAQGAAGPAVTASVAPEPAEVPPSPQGAEQGAEASLGDHALDALNTDPATEAVTMLDYWARRGPEVYAEAVTAIAAAIAETGAGLKAAVPEDADKLPESTDADAVLIATALGKQVADAGKALYDAGRRALWAYNGARPGKDITTPSGRTFTFKAGPASSRSVKYTVLEEKYPEAYAAAVTVRPRPANAPGTLYL